MDENTIKSLREALSLSPDNAPLRLHLAETLIHMNQLDEAEKEFQTILSKEDNAKAKFGLARVYYSKEQYSTCNVILEELIDADDV
ncbi:MAG: tetratricopeptide repeat protein, partial [Bacteroidota bacterium]